MMFCACTVPHLSCVGIAPICYPPSTPHGYTWGSGASLDTDPYQSTKACFRQVHQRKARMSCAYPPYAHHGTDEAIQPLSTSMESCLQEPASHCYRSYSFMRFNAYLAHLSFRRDEHLTSHIISRRSYSRALPTRSRLITPFFKRVLYWKHPARTKHRTTRMHLSWTYLISVSPHQQRNDPWRYLRPRPVL